VTKQSGKTRQVVMRLGCNQRLRNVMYHWARIRCSMTRGGCGPRAQRSRFRPGRRPRS
jgi:hypothetical protein